MHRVSILKGPTSMYLYVIILSRKLRLLSYLFQENKSYGVKNRLHSSSDVRHCTSQVTSGTLILSSLIYFKQKLVNLCFVLISQNFDRKKFYYYFYS